MYTKITERQAEVLAFIEEFIRQSGYPPTYREIAAGLHIKTARGVKVHIDALARKGFLEMHQGKARGMKLKENPHYVPMLGLAAAGFPVDTVEIDAEGYTIDPRIIGTGRRFMVKVTGDSMIEKHIDDGDWAVIDPDVQNIKNGNIILAKINGEVTIKEFKKTGNSIYLVPANRLYRTLHIRKQDNFQILGKVVVCIKKIK